MKLDKKKNLAAKTLGVGRDRVIFNINRLDEIKEAITKQDIRDLFSNGAIAVRDIKGRKAVKRRVSRRRMGSVRKKVKNGKRKYVMTGFIVPVLNDVVTKPNNLINKPINVE